MLNMFKQTKPQLSEDIQNYAMSQCVELFTELGNRFPQFNRTHIAALLSSCFLTATAELSAVLAKDAGINRAEYQESYEKWVAFLRHSFERSSQNWLN